MNKNYEFITENHNGKYYICFDPDTPQDELNKFVKEINHLLKSFDSKALSVGDKIELHLSTNKLEEQLHIINKFIKEQNK